MKEQDFILSDIKDTDNKITRLQDYPLIKRRYFELAPAIRKKEYNIKKFYEEIILTFTPPEVKISYAEVRGWALRMAPHVERYLNMLVVQEEVKDTLTLLEREQAKIKQQYEIRQDVTDLMHQYIKQLKAYIEDPDLATKLSHEQYLKLYAIIRDEEDRAKGLSLKERAENRADAMFALIVSEAKAGQLSEEDMDQLSDDIKHDLLVFKQQNGTYQLPVHGVPKIRFAAEDTVAQPS